MTLANFNSKSILQVLLVTLLLASLTTPALAENNNSTSVNQINQYSNISVEQNDFWYNENVNLDISRDGSINGHASLDGSWCGIGFDGKGTACSSNPCIIAESGQEFHDKLLKRFGGKMSFNG